MYIDTPRHGLLYVCPRAQRRVLHFLCSEFVKDSRRKRGLALEISQAALRNRVTTIFCLVSASSTHLFTITYLIGVILSSDLSLSDLIVNYIRHRFAGK